jgi:NAD(P)-dependent dehydrogenase (short-subunit alcohol dehydrogenase family)
VLVNNAGFGAQKALLDTSLAEWRAMMAINCDGVFLGMRAVIPIMRPGGSIINMSSIYGKVGGARVVTYAATKGAVTLMSKAAALECAADGRDIRINSLHPGFVDTPAVETMTAKARGRLVSMHPVGRIALPEEIADAALFLATPASSFMTGAELVIDGGFTAG